MVTIYVKSKNQEMLWKSVQSTVHQYGQGVNLNFKNVYLIVAHLSDVLRADTQTLKFLKGARVKIIDQTISSEDREKLETISERYSIRFNIGVAGSSFFADCFFWKLMGSAFIVLIIIQIIAMCTSSSPRVNCVRR